MLKIVREDIGRVDIGRVDVEKIVNRDLDMISD